jgi:hypothetical protein
MSGYGSSKAVSEALVLQATSCGYFPAVIVRPGTICASAQTFVCNPNDFLTKYLLSIVQLGIAPDVDYAAFDSVTVDYVARLICLVSYLPFDFLQSFCSSAISSSSTSSSLTSSSLTSSSLTSSSLTSSSLTSSKSLTPFCPIFHVAGDPDQMLTLPIITAAAREAKIEVQELGYGEWRTTILAMEDVDRCALVPLKSYFRGGFPSASGRLLQQTNTVSVFAKVRAGIAALPLGWNAQVPICSPCQTICCQYFRLLI